MLLALRQKAAGVKKNTNSFVFVKILKQKLYLIKGKKCTFA
jgi:hypothetical protein